jgi:hypothetical protein
LKSKKICHFINKSAPFTLSYFRTLSIYAKKLFNNKTHIERVQDEDGDELDHAVESHVFEDAERGDQSTAPLANDNWYTTDVGNSEMKNNT